MKRLTILAALAVLLTGCTSEELGAAVGADGAGSANSDTALGTGMTEIAWEEPAIAPSDGAQTEADSSHPPQMRIEYAGELVAGVMVMTTGTYCWSGTDADGNGVGVCVDCIAPDEMVAEGHVEAVLNLSELTAAPRVLMTKGAEITSVECWGGGEVQEVEFAPTGEIYFPEEPIGEAYSVNMSFPQGTVSYVFAAVEQGRQEQSAPVEEQTTPAYDPTSMTSLGQLPSGLHDPENAVYTPEPPEAELFVTTGRSAHTHSTVQCGFYWECEINGDPTAITVDCPTPYQLANTEDTKLAPLDLTEATEPLRVQLPEGAELVSVSNHGETVDMSVEFSEDGTLYLPEEPVGNVYSFTLRYPQGECSYVFVTGKVPPLPSYGEDGLWLAEGRLEYSSMDFPPTEGVLVIDSAEKYAQHFGEESAVYDCCFFETGALLVWTFSEGSGSVEHEYLGITADNEVLVRRIVPEVGTCDMAYYRLVVEVPTWNAQAGYTLKFEETGGR